MLSKMWAVVALSLAWTVSGDEGSPVSLRGSASPASAAENGTRPDEMPDLDAVVDDGEFLAAYLAEHAANATNVSEGSVPEDDFPMDLLQGSGGWFQGGDKMWGGGSGVEEIHSGNVGYYDRGMFAAHSRCGGAGCALIVNPPGHRSVQHFHIHFVHYAGYGANLKRRLESRVCGKPGWHGGGLPCHGKAAFFPGFPGVFSKAQAGGGVHHASVIAWPGACGGKGTIVELAYGCSIEHQIRGDFDARYR